MAPKRATTAPRDTPTEPRLSNTPPDLGLNVNDTLDKEEDKEYANLVRTIRDKKAREETEIDLEVKYR